MFVQGVESEFKTILERDKGSKGDSQGRKKIQATKELTYIYFIADQLSIPNKEGYNKEKSHEFAKREAGLEDDWKIDKDIDDAILKYKTLQQDIPSLNILTSLKRGLNTSAEVINILVDKMTETIKQLESADILEDDYIEDDGTFKPNPNSAAKKLEKLVGHLTKILEISSKVPKTMKEISEVEETVKKEMSEIGNIRGERTLGNREDPDYIRE